jgi:ribosome-associated protein
MKDSEIVFYAAKLAEDKKALDTEILDISNIADIADYVIICSGSTAPQLKAIARHIEESLSKLNIEPAHKEGKYGDKWFLLDYIDFVVHVIDDKARQFYNLEELWSTALFIPRDEWI